MAAPTSEDGLSEDVQQVQHALQAVRRRVHRVIVGQDELLDRILTGLLCSGHILLEGVPGLAKSLCVTTVARTLNADFRRIQFTPDLLPGDLLGSEVINPQTGEFSTRLGPIFANVVLADEINRAPAKVQSALLEAMQERQVSIGGEAYPLPDPFLVVATQNPIEQEGTYPLPEAQVDRFLLKLRVPYPERDEELDVLDRMAVSDPPRDVEGVLEVDRIVEFRRVTDRIRAERRISDYVLDIVRTTRRPAPELELDRLVEWGASPRAAIHMLMAARARALLRGRRYVTPDDVKHVAPDVLRHRIILTFEAEAEGVEPDQVVRRVLDHVPVR